MLLELWNQMGGKAMPLLELWNQSGGKAVPLLELWNQMGNIDEEAIPQKGKHDAS